MFWPETLVLLSFFLRGLRYCEIIKSVLILVNRNRTLFSQWNCLCVVERFLPTDSSNPWKIKRHSARPVLSQRFAELLCTCYAELKNLCFEYSRIVRKKLFTQVCVIVWITFLFRLNLVVKKPFPVFSHERKLTTPDGQTCFWYANTTLSSFSFHWIL